jgi:hypothetical protein
LYLHNFKKLQPYRTKDNPNGCNIILNQKRSLLIKFIEKVDLISQEIYFNLVKNSVSTLMRYMIELIKNTTSLGSAAPGSGQLSHI